MKIQMLIAMTLLLGCAGCGTQQAQSVTAEVYAMDTVMQLTAYGDQAQEAVEQAQTTIYALENSLSRTLPNSGVSLLNDQGTAEVDATTQEVLFLALEYGALTQGAFSCTIAPVMDAWGFTTDGFQVPSEAELAQAMALMDDEQVLLGDTGQVSLGAGQSIDLGGIAKGYTSQMVGEIFKSYGLDHGMVSLGGNVYVQGGRPDGDPWRIGVQNPQNIATYAGVLTMYDGFAITSGGYQRYFEEDGVTYHHIIDPKTGYPANTGLLSVTVVSPDNGTLCDALSTALFVMGEEDAIGFWRSGVAEFDMILLTEDNRAIVTQGLDGQFAVQEGYTYALCTKE